MIVAVVVTVVVTVPMIVPVIVPVLMTVPVELARGRNRRGLGLLVRRVRAVQDCWAGEEEVIRQHLHGDVRGVEAGHVGDLFFKSATSFGAFGAIRVCISRSSDSRAAAPTKRSA